MELWGRGLQIANYFQMFKVNSNMPPTGPELGDLVEMGQTALKNQGRWAFTLPKDYLWKMVPPSPLLVSGLYDQCPQLCSAGSFHIAKSWRDQGRGHAEFPQKLCGNSLSYIALQKKNTSEQPKYRLFNVEVLRLPPLCQSVLHVMLSK